MAPYSSVRDRSASRSSVNALGKCQQIEVGVSPGNDREADGHASDRGAGQADLGNASQATMARQARNPVSRKREGRNWLADERRRKRGGREA